MCVPSLVVKVLMVGFPLRGLKGVEAFACSEVSAIVAAGRLAAAATPALPIRNRRRDGEGSAGAMADWSSLLGLMVDIVDLITNKSGADTSCCQSAMSARPLR